MGYLLLVAFDNNNDILVGYLLRVAFDNINDNNNDHTSNKDTKNNDKTDKNDHITIILKILIIEILSNSSSNHMKDHQGTREPGDQIIIMLMIMPVTKTWPELTNLEY